MMARFIVFIVLMLLIIISATFIISFADTGLWIFDPEYWMYKRVINKLKHKYHREGKEFDEKSLEFIISDELEK